MWSLENFKGFWNRKEVIFIVYLVIGVVVVRVCLWYVKGFGYCVKYFVVWIGCDGIVYWNISKNGIDWVDKGSVCNVKVCFILVMVVDGSYW